MTAKPKNNFEPNIETGGKDLYYRMQMVLTMSWAVLIFTLVPHSPDRTVSVAAPSRKDVGNTVSLLIPCFPPSTNHYWKTATISRRYISREGVQFRRTVQDACRGVKAFPADVRLSLSVVLYPPDHRRRDLDNFGGKALLDALQHAGVYADDSQIDRLEITRGAVSPPGRVECRLRTLTSSA